MRGSLRKTKKKAKDCIAHFEFRCLQRLGVVLSQDMLKQLMLEHRLEVVCRESTNKTHFKVPQYLLPNRHKEEVVAVYDKVRHCFVTVLLANRGI